MKRGMTIEYLKCRKDLNFEVDFRINDAILFDNGLFSFIIHFYLFKYASYAFNLQVVHYLLDDVLIYPDFM